VIIGDFDVVRISVNPDEAQTPLIVDTGQMPTLSFAFKGFEGVTGTFETGARFADRRVVPCPCTRSSGSRRRILGKTRDVAAERNGMNSRAFDLVVYGASGFVGRRVARYLAATSRTGPLRWAIAGRDRSKLDAVITAAGADADVLVAGGSDSAAIDGIVARTAVVLNTAGPFARYGDPVVDACVRHGTHYVDITGETPWVRSLIDRYDARAAAGGTRIVPCCGFDSVPSDLGALLAARHVRETSGRGCGPVKAFFAMAGGLNGGTLASLMAISEDPALLQQVRDPFLLSPSRPSTRSPLDADPVVPHFDRDARAWIAPFFMSPINTRVVRRSSALFAAWNEPYGEHFAYQEYLRFGGRFGLPQALAVAAASALVTSALARATVRRAVRPLLPKPGTGPSEAAMRDGWFRCDVVARGEDGTAVCATIRDRGDPGNVATTKFVCEAALALALEPVALPGNGRGGVLTPATAFGDVLVRRLSDAGMTLELT